MTIKIFQPGIWQEQDKESDPLKKKALEIVCNMSGDRVTGEGGYHDLCAFIDDLIVIASVSGGEPTLTIEKTIDFVKDNEDMLDDTDEDDDESQAT